MWTKCVTCKSTQCYATFPAALQVCLCLFNHRCNVYLQNTTTVIQIYTSLPLLVRVVTELKEILKPVYSRNEVDVRNKCALYCILAVHAFCSALGYIPDLLVKRCCYIPHTFNTIYSSKYSKLCVTFHLFEVFSCTFIVCAQIAFFATISKLLLSL
jgi:hypothetical protein